MIKDITLAYKSKVTVDVKEITFESSFIFNLFADMCSKHGSCPMPYCCVKDHFPYKEGMDCCEVKPHHWESYFLSKCGDVENRLGGSFAF